MSAPPLGSAASFAVLGNTTVTNTGLSMLTGNLGLSPGTSITGFPPGTYSGGEYIADSTSATAQSDATTAYNNLAGQPAGTPESSINGPITLNPGVYTASSGLSLSGTITLNGNSSSVFVFQVGSTLTSASNTTIVLSGGVLASNVFWQVGSSATLGTGTAFQGTIIANTSITANTGASSNGSLIALNGAVTLDDNNVTATDPAACLHPDTIVKTNKGDIPIKYIQSGDLVYKENGEPVQVLYNIKLNETRNLFLIKKDSFGPNQPMNDLYITDTHPLLIDNQYVKPCQFINYTTILPIKLDAPVNLYSLCTVNQEFVLIEGLNVSTWRESDWIATQSKFNIQWVKQ